MRKLIYLALSLFFISLGSALAEDKNTAVTQGSGSGSQAGDTYNFYFQKAPGPTTVNQGTSGSPAAAPANAPSTPTQEEEAIPATTTRVQPNEVVKEKIPRWSVALLYGRFKDEVRDGTNPSFGLSFDFRFNKNIALTTGIIKGTSGEGMNKAETTDLFFGADFTPLHARFDDGGGFEFGLGVGLMTSDYMESKTDYGFSSSDWWSSSSTPKTKRYSATKIVAYAGPQMNILFNRNFGLTVETRFASSKAQHYGAGLLFRF